MLKSGGNVLPDSYLELSEAVIAAVKGKKVDVSPEFVLMIVRIVSLDPQHNFLLKRFLQPTELDRLKRVTIESILSMSSIARQIILMQLHYETNSFTRDELMESEHERMETLLRVTLNELALGIPTQRKHREAHYDKIIFATITKTGVTIESGNEYKVIQQTKAALSSILPPADVDLLSALNCEARETEIRNIIQIAVGVRIFNKFLDPENSGDGLPDLEKTLSDKVKATLVTLAELRDRTLARLVYYSTLIQSILLNPAMIKRPGRRGITQETLLIRQGLTMIHQLLKYVRVLDLQLCNEESLSKSMIDSFQNCMKELRVATADSQHTPTFKRFPKFIHLANTWQGIRDSLGIVTNCADLLSAIEDFSEGPLQDVDSIVRGRLEGQEEKLLVPTVEEFLATGMDEQFPRDFNLRSGTVRRQSFTPEDSFLDTEYSGFCIWSFVEGFGMILLSSPTLGVFHFNEKKYLLSTAQAALDFVTDPTTYIHKAIHIALKWPEFIYLLKMEDDIFRPEIVAEAIRTTSSPKSFLYTDSEIQTELHPVPANIVEGYSWNEWDYRRQAVILSNVHKSVTHSTQTYIQSINSSQASQTYPLKSRRVQTNRSVSTEAPRSQFYFYGLRGYHCNTFGVQPPHIVQLTREPVLDFKKVKYPSPPIRLELPPAEPVAIMSKTKSKQ